MVFFQRYMTTATILINNNTFLENGPEKNSIWLHRFQKHPTTKQHPNSILVHISCANWLTGKRTKNHCCKTVKCIDATTTAYVQWKNNHQQKPQRRQVTVHRYEPLLRDLLCNADSVNNFDHCFSSRTCFQKTPPRPPPQNAGDVGLAVDLRKHQVEATLQDGKRKIM